MGIEPTLAAWEAAVLPLNYTRMNDSFYSGSPARGNLAMAAPLIAILCVAISGCVAIPIPASKSQPALAGKKVEAADLAKIIPLETSQLPLRRTGYVPIEISSGQGLVTIHRAPPARASLGFFSRARFAAAVGIAVDGHYVAELLDDEYVSVGVSAGTHEITVHPAPPYRWSVTFPADQSLPSIHPSSVTVALKDGERCFLETVATLAAGLSYDTQIRSLPEDEATPAMSRAQSIW